MGVALEHDGHPVAYMLHRPTNTDMHCQTGDRGLLAFIVGIRKWDIYLRGRQLLFMTDQEPIKYLQSESQCSGRQCRWIYEIQSHSYIIERISRNKTIFTDACNRRPDFHLEYLARINSNF